MDFITKLPRTRSGHDAIWVMVDRLTKSAHFLAIREDYSTKKLARLYTDEIVARHGVVLAIILDHDAWFTLHGHGERIIQTLEDMLRACVIDFGGSWDVHLPLAEFSYNKNYHTSIRCAPFEALYGRKCRSPMLWAEIGEGSLIGPELVQEMSGVHDTFNLLNLKKCLADASLHVPLDDIKVGKTLHFVKEPIEIMDREIKSLKRSKISLLKVR
ncbi:putative reverse transcriptase domain-containing protein [Tanacetum coccineum]